MSNLEKYNKIFREVFLLEEEAVNSELSMLTLGAWDSVIHMTLMSAVEDEFDIMLDTDDIVDFISYEKGKEILEKYEIQF